MSDRSAEARRWGGGGYDWRRGGGSSSGSTGAVTGDYLDYLDRMKTGEPSPDGEVVAGSSYTKTGNIQRRNQDRYFNPVALYYDIPSTQFGLNFSSPRPIIQDKAKAVARWDAPPGSPEALPDWLREAVTQMAYSYQGRKVPDSWVRGFWEKSIGSAAELGGTATALQAMYTKVLADEQSGPGGGGGGGYSSYGGGGYGGGGGGGGSVSLTDPTSARGLLMQTMQGVLGRNPTTREYRDFLDTLNQTEMANPRTVSFEGDVAVQSGGVDPSVLALEFAQGAEDYKATQANKFYNAFMGALAGGISG